jgi:hypothetical protein
MLDWMKVWVQGPFSRGRPVVCQMSVTLMLQPRFSPERLLLVLISAEKGRVPSDRYYHEINDGPAAVRAERKCYRWSRGVKTVSACCGGGFQPMLHLHPLGVKPRRM